ncbi:MAG: hypothetical protein ABI630_05305, partial [Betaproteobacteria bacterium]
MKPNLVFAAVLAAAMTPMLAGCDRDDGARVVAVSNGQPSQEILTAGPTQSGTVKDPSLPDAAAVFAARDPEERRQATIVVEQKAASPLSTESQPQAPSSANTTGAAAPPTAGTAAIVGPIDAPGTTKL